MDKWRENNSDKIRAKRVAWYAANREVSLERSAAYYAANADKLKAAQRARTARSPLRGRAACKAWRAANPERKRYHKDVARARCRVAMPKWLTRADRDRIAAYYREARHMSAETGKLHSVDHIYPLKGRTVCGLHVPDNLRVMPWIDNVVKGNRLDPV